MARQAKPKLYAQSDNIVFTHIVAVPPQGKIDGKPVDTLCYRLAIAQLGRYAATLIPNPTRPIPSHLPAIHDRPAVDAAIRFVVGVAACLGRHVVW